MPRRNRTLWAEKFRRNRERDRRTVVALRSLRYATLVIWECELRDGARLSRRVEKFFACLPPLQSGASTPSSARPRAGRI